MEENVDGAHSLGVVREETIGGCRLILADCLSVIPSIEAVDAVVTDPPYSSGGQYRGDRAQSTRNKYQSSDVIVEHPEFSGDNRDQRSFGFWCALWLGAALRRTKPGGMLCMFTDWRQLPMTTDAIQAGGWLWRGIVPWDKRTARPMADRFRAQCEYIVAATNGARSTKPTEESIYHPGIFSFSAPSNQSRQHTTQKPVELMEELVKVAPLGGAVLDPFMGSGSTLVACVRQGRRGIGIEMSPEYFDIACERVRDACNQADLFSAQDGQQQAATA